MKTKKIISALALGLCFTTLCSCTNVDQKIPFYGYWHTNSIAAGANIHETLEYDVTGKLASNLSNLVGYELSYDNGVYTTELISESRDGKSIYVYKTSLTLSVTYTLNGESKTFEDSVQTEATFLSESYGLKPLSSQKTVVSASPTMGNEQTKLDDCYVPYHYTVKTTYNQDGSAGTCEVNYAPDKEDADTSTHDFDIDDKYSYLDNEQLLFALRGVPDSKTSTKIYTYSPYVNAVQTMKVSFATAESDEFTFFKNGSEEKEKYTISYRPATIVLDQKFSGESQTVHYAALTDPSNNPHRNVMLYYNAPLAYALGSLEYKLRSINYN